MKYYTNTDEVSFDGFIFTVETEFTYSAARLGCRVEDTVPEELDIISRKVVEVYTADDAINDTSVQEFLINHYGAHVINEMETA